MPVAELTSLGLGFGLLLPHAWSADLWTFDIEPIKSVGPAQFVMVQNGETCTLKPPSDNGPLGLLYIAGVRGLSSGEVPCLGDELSGIDVSKPRNPDHALVVRAQQRRQTFPPRGRQWADLPPRLIYAGDLDGDKIVDLLLYDGFVDWDGKRELTADEPRSLSLWLSSMGTKRQPWGLAARTSYTGSF